ncbi:MAG: bifunctional serine/threonine-protein kinase/formylglycine-generating enzyme family protein [Pseudomonadota bacterium]
MFLSVRPRSEDPTPCRRCGVANPGPTTYCRVCGARLSGREPASLVGHRIGGWRITRLVGRGGLGEAYVGEREEAGNRSAVALIKVPRNVPLDPGRRAAICRCLHEEAETLRSLDHPHIVPLLDVLPYRGSVALVMRYVPGLDLGTVLSLAHQVHKTPPAWVEIVRWVGGICDALHHAHSHPARPILHGDVKPRNILVEEGSGVPWLIDFGLARALGGDHDVHPGTTAYAPPEILEGHSPGVSADVYSLGATLYEVAAGAPPFAVEAGRNAVAQAAYMRRHPPRPLTSLRPDLPTGVAEAIHRAIALNPADRFQSCPDFHAALVPGGAGTLRTTEIHAASLEPEARFGSYRLGHRAAANPLWETWSAWGLDSGERVWLQILREPRCHAAMTLVEDGLELRTPRVRGLRARNPWYHPPYLVQRALQDEETLPEVLLRGPLTLPEALSILGQVLAALRQLHLDGHAHRCLQAGAVAMASSTGQVCLLGLGLVGLLRPFLPTDGRTGDAAILRGFPELAPEQRRGEPAGPSADVFAAARLALRLLGVADAGDPEAALRALDLPASLVRLLVAATGPEPWRRPEVDVLLYAVRHHTGEEDLAPGELRAVESIARRIRKHRGGRNLPDLPDLVQAGDGGIREVALLFSIIERVGRSNWESFIEPWRRTFQPAVRARRVDGRLSSEAQLELEGIRIEQGVPRIAARAIEAESGPDALLIDGIPFVQVPGGTVMLGAETGRPDEGPRHRVCLRRFLLSRAPISAGQYGRFVIETGHPSPAFLELTAPAAQDSPVAGVSWFDAMEFCEWLSRRVDARVNLPTEAQWEFAASGGTLRSYPWGDAAPVPRYARFGDLDGRPDAGDTRGAGASACGARDLAGNVWEWCRDWYDEAAYRDRPLFSPTGPRKGTVRVLRGGSYMSPPDRLRCTARDRDRPEVALPSYGFRVVIELD